MKFITSSENPVIKRAIGLKQRKVREKEGCYLIEGLHICKEALRVLEDIELILIRESLFNDGKDEDLKEIIKQLNSEKTKGVLIEDRLFDKVADTGTPQGIMAIVKRREWDKKTFINRINDTQSGNLLILDRIQDPGNAGTLIRTAEAAEFYGIIAVKGTVDIYSPKVVRSASGSILRQQLLFTEDAEETANLLSIWGKKMVVAAPHGHSYHFEHPLARNIALVIGNEAGGACKTFIEKADLLVKIPMAHDVESLNAAVAGGILMYESVRQNFHNKAEE